MGIPAKVKSALPGSREEDNLAWMTTRVITPQG